MAIKPKKQMPANKGETGGGTTRGTGSRLTGVAADIQRQLKKGVPMKSSTGKITVIKPKKKGM